MRFFTTLLVAGCCLLTTSLSAQLFTDSILVAAQPEENVFSFEYLLPSGQTGAGEPLLVYVYNNSPVLVYPAEGNTFRFDTLAPIPFLRDVIRYEDFNGDGFDDIISSRGNIDYGSADSTFTRVRTTELDLVYNFGDWDGDGLTDAFGYKRPRFLGPAGNVFFANALRDSMAFAVDTLDFALNNEGGGQFAFVNGDTLADFCYLGGNPPNFTLFCLINDGAGGYTSESQNVGADAGALIMADFNGDGFDDVVVASSAFGGINLTYNNGGTFQGTTPQEIYDGGSLDYVMGPGGASDIDGDGDLDLIVTLKTFFSAVYDIAYLINNGTGFDDPVFIGSYPGIADSRQIGIQYNIQGVRVLDLNGDGNKDILVNSTLAQITYAFFNTPPPPVAVRNLYLTAAVVDVYPNPVSDGELTLEISADVQLTEAILIDATGRSVNARLNGRSLSVDGLPSGLYTVIFVDAKDKYYRARFVKE